MLPMVYYEDVQHSLNSQEIKLSDALLKLESYAMSQQDTLISEWARLELAGYQGQDLMNSLSTFGLRNNYAETFIDKIAPYRRKFSDYPDMFGISRQIAAELNSLPSDLGRRYILHSVASVEEGRAIPIGRQSESFLSRVRTEAKRKFQSFSPAFYATPDFSLIVTDKELSALLENRWREANTTFRAGVYLSTIVLLGSILEGVLFGKIEQNFAQANQATSMPKDKNGKPKLLKNLNLEEIINVCHECSWIDADVRDFSKALRDYRNLVHPRQQLAEGLTPNAETCKISFEVVQAAIKDLSK